MINNWKTVPLIELADYLNGYAFKPEDHVKDGLPIIRIEQLKDDSAEFDYYDKPVPERNMIKNGDLIFSWSASLFLRIWDRGDAILNQHLFKVIPKPDVDKNFLKYCIDYNLPELTNSAHGSTMKHITRKELKRFSVSLPSQKKEQSKIAEVLSTIDRAIAQTEALIAKHQRIKTGLMQDLLTRGIDEHGQLRDESTHKFKSTPLGMIPVEWEVALMDHVAKRGSGHTPNKSKPEYWNGGIKWISLADSDKLDKVYIYETDKNISELGIENSSAVKHPPGTVVISRDAGIGKSAITTETMAVSQHFIAWVCGNKLDNHYLYYSLQSKKADFEAAGFGTTIKTIGLLFFKKLQIILPPKDEQEKISKILLHEEKQIVELNENLAKLHKVKTGLMQDLLSGEVSVTPLMEE